MVDELELLIDLHRDGERQGPGGADQTRLALDLSGLREKTGLKIADIGCGTGASTRVLAQDLDADITALDLVPDFLAGLTDQSQGLGLRGRIETEVCGMDALPFAPGALDAIWSEGAIYNLGFERGVSEWRRFLKPGGILAVSELTWFTAERPDELNRHWAEHYPEVATASDKIAVLERAGYALLGYFPLPEACWMEAYYGPLRARFPDFLARHENSNEAQALLVAEEAEIALYERYAAYFGYGFYVARVGTTP
ncbi:MAG: methyltransferase domain-containing protein [Pseudomonadota bacterium]